MYVIAEIGTNHNGKEQTAFELVNAAVKTGVQAVKMNYWKADLLADRSSNWYRRCKELELSISCLRLCSGICHDEGLDFIVAPWAPELVEEAYEVADKFKIASGELNYDSLLFACSKKNISTILSTGMATRKEILHATELLDPDVIMHCVSLYPTPYNHVNLKRIKNLQDDFWYIDIGYSSHTEGIQDVLAAYVLGAKIIEKHFNILENRCVDEDISLSITCTKLMIENLKRIDSMMEDATGEDFINKSKLRRGGSGLRE